MTNNNHNFPEALVLSCIDFRFHRNLYDVLGKEGISSFDILTFAGGAKNLSSPKEEYYKNGIIDNIKLAIELHHIKKLILCNHIDCGAYGGSKKFESIEEEMEFHKQELKKAEDLAKKLFPLLEIKTIILSL